MRKRRGNIPGRKKERYRDVISWYVETDKTGGETHPELDFKWSLFIPC